MCAALCARSCTSIVSTSLRFHDFVPYENHKKATRHLFIEELLQLQSLWLPRNDLMPLHGWPLWCWERQHIMVDQVMQTTQPDPVWPLNATIDADSADLAPKANTVNLAMFQRRVNPRPIARTPLTASRALRRRKAPWLRRRRSKGESLRQNRFVAPLAYDHVCVMQGPYGASKRGGDRFQDWFVVKEDVFDGGDERQSDMAGNDARSVEPNDEVYALAALGVSATSADAENDVRLYIVAKALKRLRIRHCGAAGQQHNAFSSRTEAQHFFRDIVFHELECISQENGKGVEFMAHLLNRGCNLALVIGDTHQIPCRGIRVRVKTDKQIRASGLVGMRLEECAQLQLSQLRRLGRGHRLMSDRNLRPQ